MSMNPKQAQRLLGLLCTKAPRQAAESILEFLADDSGAGRAALFSVADDSDCSLFCGKEIDQNDLDWCDGMWQQSWKRLVKGFAVREELRLLYPIRHENSVVGLLYVEAADVDEATIMDVAPSLSDSIVRARVGMNHTAITGYVESTPLDEMERDKLKLLFRKHEFRHALVARVLEMNRVSLYRRLEKYGLREWVASGRAAFRASLTSR